MAQLTELKIKAIKPSEKMARYYDGSGRREILAFQVLH